MQSPPTPAFAPWTDATERELQALIRRKQKALLQPAPGAPNPFRLSIHAHALDAAWRAQLAPRDRIMPNAADCDFTKLTKAVEAQARSFYDAYGEAQRTFELPIPCHPIELIGLSAATASTAAAIFEEATLRVSGDPTMAVLRAHVRAIVFDESGLGKMMLEARLGLSNISEEVYAAARQLYTVAFVLDDITMARPEGIVLIPLIFAAMWEDLEFNGAWKRYFGPKRVALVAAAVAFPTKDAAMRMQAGLRHVDAPGGAGLQTRLDEVLADDPAADGDGGDGATVMEEEATRVDGSGGAIDEERSRQVAVDAQASLAGFEERPAASEGAKASGGDGVTDLLATFAAHELGEPPAPQAVDAAAVDKAEAALAVALANSNSPPPPTVAQLAQSSNAEALRAVLAKLATRTARRRRSNPVVLREDAYVVLDALYDDDGAMRRKAEPLEAEARSKSDAAKAALREGWRMGVAEDEIDRLDRVVEACERAESEIRARHVYDRAAAASKLGNALEVRVSAGVIDPSRGAQIFVAYGTLSELGARFADDANLDRTITFTFRAPHADSDAFFPSGLAIGAIGVAACPIQSLHRGETQDDWRGHKFCLVKIAKMTRNRAKWTQDGLEVVKSSAGANFSLVVVEPVAPGGTPTAALPAAPAEDPVTAARRTLAVLGAELENATTRVLRVHGVSKREAIVARVKGRIDAVDICDDVELRDIRSDLVRRAEALPLSTEAVAEARARLPPKSPPKARPTRGSIRRAAAAADERQPRIAAATGAESAAAARPASPLRAPEKRAPPRSPGGAVGHAAKRPNQMVERFDADLAALNAHTAAPPPQPRQEPTAVEAAAPQEPVGRDEVAVMVHPGDERLELASVLQYDRSFGGGYEVQLERDKEIVELPAKRVRRLDPHEDDDFAKGEPVLALFPETTSFRRAVVAQKPKRARGGAPLEIVVTFEARSERRQRKGPGSTHRVSSRYVLRNH